MKKLTEITIVLDRSGSMQTIANETIQGFNAFLQEQKSIKSKAKLTLVQFDHEYQILYEAMDLREALPLTNRTFVPRGMTSLYDAIGKTIELTKKRLKLLSNNGTAYQTIFVIITDGHENNSKYYSRKQIFKNINKQEKKHQWQFVYLGANQDAIEAAGFIGIPKERAMTFKAESERVFMLFNSISENINETMESDLPFVFSDDQRKEQDDDEIDSLQNIF
jgi:uncharacterized protein YegL